MKLLARPAAQLRLQHIHNREAGVDPDQEQCREGSEHSGSEMDLAGALEKVQTENSYENPEGAAAKIGF